LGTLNSIEKEGLSRRSIAFDGMAYLFTIFIVGFLPAFKWLQLFPLVEFRQKIFRDNGFAWLMENWTLRGANMFSTAEYFDNWVGKTCSTSIPCLNALPLLIHLSTATALFVFAKRVFGRRLIASIVTGLWVTSVPYLQTLAWQALDLDKIAALTTTAGAMVGIHFFRAQYNKRNVILSNFLLFILVLAGYNAKPSAWVLVPGLWLLPITGNGLGLKNWSKYLIAPTLYGLTHNFRWYRLVQADDFYRNHTSSGDPLANVSKFIGYLHGSLIPTTSSQLCFLVVIGALLLGATLKRPISRFGIWCLLMVIGGIVIACRTQYGSPFYMLVSQVFYSLAVGAVLMEVLVAIKKYKWKGLSTLCICFVAVVLVFLPGIRTSYTAYDSVLNQSDNFRNSFETIDNAFEDPVTHQLKLVFVIEEIMDYVFIDGGMVQPFMPSGFPINDSKTSWELRSDFDASSRAADTVYVLFDNNMNLEKIVKPSTSTSP